MYLQDPVVNSLGKFFCLNSNSKAELISYKGALCFNHKVVPILDNDLYWTEVGTDLTQGKVHICDKEYFDYFFILWSYVLCYLSEWEKTNPLDYPMLWDIPPYFHSTPSPISHSNLQAWLCDELWSFQVKRGRSTKAFIHYWPAKW